MNGRPMLLPQQVAFRTRHHSTSIDAALSHAVHNAKTNAKTRRKNGSACGKNGQKRKNGSA